MQVSVILILTRKKLCAMTLSNDILDIDRHGNSLYIAGDKIFLHLKVLNRKLLLATIRAKDLFIKRDFAKHLFRKGNAYGFNYAMLKHAKRIKIISLRDDYNLYNVPIDFIISQGKFLNFKQKGFEKQIFLSLTQLDEWKSRV